ncbi:MAG TPA: hypothetical protein VIM59_04160 [Cellvibrio sp.]
MSENNPYQTPQSNLQELQPHEYSVNPDWTIEGVLKEAWELISGFKATAWGALLIYLGITIAVTIPFEFLGKDSAIIGFIGQIIIGLVTYPIYAGITMLAIRRSVGAPTNAFMVFNFYSKIMPIFLLYVLMMILIMVGLVLLVLPGIYLMVAYSLAIPLLVEKNMRLWDALETSRKMVSKRWFSVFGIYLVLLVIIVISMLPLGIGLIWAFPLALVVPGIIYRNMFGVKQPQ